jgi:hypothetical protein
MTTYLNTKVNDIISADPSLQRRIQKPTEVEAYVNLSSNGKVEKVQLIKSSFDSNIDTLFIKSIRKMPTWIPATNELGNNCKDKQIVKYDLRITRTENTGSIVADPVDTTGMYKIYNKKK